MCVLAEGPGRPHMLANEAERSHLHAFLTAPLGGRSSLTSENFKPKLADPSSMSVGARFFKLGWAQDKIDPQITSNLSVPSRRQAAQ